MIPGPIQTEIVVVTAGSHYEVKISVADGAMTAARFVEQITGVAPRRLLVDGFPVLGEQPMMEVPLVRGSHLEVVDDAHGEPLCTLVGLIGEAAAEVINLSAGVHQIGCVDVDVQARGNQGGAACLYVDVDGAAWIDPVDAEVMIDGAPVTSMTSLSPGNEVRIGRQSYRFGRVVDRSRGKRRIAFNRPPRSQFPASLPLLVAPSAPPEALQPMRFGWGALLIPVLLGGVMALLWNPMMAIFALLSPAMMLANWYEDKRRTGRANEEAAADVLQAMTVFRRRFTALFDAARGLAWRGSPGPAELLERLVAGDSRMWERRHGHTDFMELGLGVGTLQWAPEVVPSEPDRAAEANELIAASTELPDVPVTVALGDGQVLGIAGHRRRQIEMVRWLVCQAAAHHGPADMSIALITDDADEWDWMKWLPQLQRNGDGSQLAVAALGEAADDLLWPLLDGSGTTPVVATRGREEGPTVLVVVDVEDVTTAAAASVRRVLSGDGARRRCGIALATTVEELPSSCTDVVRVDAGGLAILDRPSRAQRVGPIHTWRLAGAAARRVARRIGMHVDPELNSNGGSLADVVHLMDLIALGERTSDAVVRRWAAAGPVPQCVAPIGATADGPLVVDWVGDGPHGLLAGTTGSGKSELLRSLVASLAVSIDPEHLNFVLIDYKGGSAFDACAALPHTVGMVTDLDGRLAQRALTCLEAELVYREEMLRDVAAADIDDYHAAGCHDPLPRLLVVIDEFAALAKELPDFMAALVDVAQRGRSLGVHLLLATQRPNGVINDSIRANTNLRLSLRCQDVADSMDVIGTADAAALSRRRPGRGYLRRGPGEVVAFQSAMVTGHSGGAAATLTVSPFRLVPEPELPAAAGVGASARQSDLEALVLMIREAATKAGMRPARLPWPDPLPGFVGLDELKAAGAGTGASAGEVSIGLADEPHRQRRRPFVWDTKTNLLVYGVQGSGTSSALITAVTAACLAASPHELHVYALDFDDQRLNVVSPLPHVGAVIGAGDRDRQLRLLRYLVSEVAERRELAAVDSQACAGKAHIVVAVDNFAGFRAAFDDAADMGIKESLSRLVADGPGVGIVVIATAKQPIDIPMQVASLVPGKLVMRLADRHDYTGLGVMAGDPPGVAGRGFQAGTSLEVQLAAIDAAEIAELAATFPPPDAATGPWSIRLLPIEVKIPDIAAGAEVYDLEWKVPVALGDDRLTPVGWLLREGDHVLITGPARSGKSTTLTTIAAVLRFGRPDIRITALAPRRSPLGDCPDVDVHVTDPEQLRGTLASQGPDHPHAVLIDDAETVDDAAGVVAALITDRHAHRHIFAAGTADVLRGCYGHWTQGVRRSRLGLALKPNVSNDGDLWQSPLPRRGPGFFPVGRGYLVADGHVELAQVAWQ